ncbi:2-methylpropanoate--CoA ligase CCL4-like [Aegilops tauschii subsp. strangulata]|uniref:2-methylpropanoate--CoA ligase CCL4-like n=1 Tax=Aegilops tauschii subsp. strangulata TaxID=200361 RepID=UPI003CC897AA
MKKRLANGTIKCDSPGVDRLGGLPDDVLGRILGFLPTPLAVRATQLSRRWRRLWPAHVFALNLSVQDCKNRGVGVRFPDLCARALARFPIFSIPSISLEFCTRDQIGVGKAKAWYAEAMERAAGSVSVTVLRGAFPLALPRFTQAEALSLTLTHRIDLELPAAGDDPLLQACSLTTEHLELDLVLPDEMTLDNWLGPEERGSPACEDLMRHVPPLPRVTVLSLKVRWGIGGDVGPCLASLLSRVPSVATIHVGPAPYCLTVLGGAVVPRGECRWGRCVDERSSGGQLGSLREIVVHGLRGTDGEECSLVEVLLGTVPPSIERISLRCSKLGPNPANSCPLTPLGFLELAATAYRDCPSVIYHDTVYTWSQTFRRCLRLASALASIGIAHRDVVSVLLPNVPAMYEMQFGVPMSGAILNNINTRLDARTVSVLLHHSGSKLVLVDPASLQLLEDALRLLPPEHSAPRVVVADDPHEKELLPAPATALTYERLLEKGDPDFAWVRPANEWEPMILNYTSGTTSAPKGVLHCHRGIFLITLDSLVDWGMPARPTYLWTLPMFHVNGWSFPWGMAVVGGTNVCLRRVDAADVYAAISRHGVTHLCGAPVVLNMLANAPEAVRKTLPGNVEILTGGAPPPAAVLHRTEAIGFKVRHGYGLCETAGLATSCVWNAEWDKLPATERARFKARQGVRTPATAEVDVVDEKSGRSMPRDGSTVGEVVIRGGGGDPGDGWFYTGDVGVMHPDGYLEIRDRSKDVIISGGENISSVEVESVLGELTEAELVAWSRERIPRYMVPKTVVFRDELPKTSTGKIQKYVLRNIAKEMGPTSRGVSSKM